MRSFLLCLFAGLCVSHVSAAPTNLDREIVLTPPAARSGEDIEIMRWQERAGGASATCAEFERLGWAYVAKARRTLDAGYYQLALKTADVIDAQFGQSDSAALLRGHALHNLHRFREAESVARKLTESRGLADDFALLSDALMEQGRISEAIVALQRAADLRPNSEIDTRIAHIRWLKGDLAGAVAAMTQAVRETSPVDHEPIAWMLTQLAGFELERGNLDRAGELAAAAAKHVPDFSPVLLTQGKVALTRGEPEIAVKRLRRAAELNPLPEYQWWLADALDVSGKGSEAANVRSQIVDAGVRSDPRTTALYLATSHRDASTAIELCQAELEVRADVQTHDALAWSLYAAGDFAHAAEESRAALALGTADSRLRLHAAMIALATGRREDAAALLAKCEPAALRPSERQLYGDTATRLGIAGQRITARSTVSLCRR